LIPLVQVWPHPRVTGWRGTAAELAPDDGPPPDHPQVPLDEALEAEHEVDAHCTQYALYLDGEPLDEAPRVRKEALERLSEQGLEVRLGCVLVDVDAPEGIEAAGEPAVAEWYLGQLAALEDCPQPRWRYRTRGGYRLVYVLDRHVVPDEHERIAAVLRSRIRASSGEVVDPCKNTKDWTHCFRLPYVVRDGKPQAYDLEVLGQVAALDVEELLSDAPPAAVKGRFRGLAEARTPGTPKRIPHGRRNGTLASIAGSMRAQGLDASAILAALEVIDQTRCDPPFDSDDNPEGAAAGREELAKIAESIGSYPAPDPVERVSKEVELPGLELGSEVEIAGQVLQVLENGGPQLAFDRGMLWGYDPATGIWSEVRPSQIYGVVSALDGALVGAGRDAHYLRIGARTCSNVVALVRSYRDAPGWFDVSPIGGVAFANGVAIVRNGAVELLPPDPDHRLLHQLPFDYDPVASCSTFEHVLDVAFDGTADATQRCQVLWEYVGACLIGQAVRYHKALLLYGEGANGKSTVLSVFSALFPSHARAAIPPQLMHKEYHRAALAEALINVVAEVPESDIVAAEAVKAFISGDEVVARRTYNDPFHFRPKAGNLWACNTLPGVRDFSDGFWRRWIAIEFPNSIPPELQDEGIGRHVIFNELPGVAAQALAAAARLDARGRLEPPPSSREARDQWRMRADQVAAYADAKLAVEPNAEPIAAQRLYDDYKVWALRNGYRPLSNRRFAERLRRLGYRRATKGPGGRRWEVSIVRKPAGPGSRTVH
jgi:putative DNA primase/helicase